MINKEFLGHFFSEIPTLLSRNEWKNKLSVSLDFENFVRESKNYICQALD